MTIFVVGLIKNNLREGSIIYTLFNRRVCSYKNKNKNFHWMTEFSNSTLTKQYKRRQTNA